MRASRAVAAVIVSTWGAIACAAFGVSGRSPDDSGGAADSGVPDASEAEASLRAGSVPHGPATDLAIGAPLPRDLVVDSSNVYWICEPEADGGSIWTVPKKPSPGPATIVVPSDVLSKYQPTSVALAADTAALYWSHGPAVTRQAKAGGPTTTVFWLGQSGGDGICGGLAIEPGKVYLATTGYGRAVLGNSTDGPDNAAFSLDPALPSNVSALTVDATDVYAGQKGQIVKLPKGGVSASPATVFTITDGPVAAIANDTDTVYWVDSSTVRSLAKKDIGGTPTDLARGQYDPSAIALDAANVYWTNGGDGVVRTVPKGGGDVTTLATGEAQPTAIAVDATGVFWTNYADGRVRVIWR